MAESTKQILLDIKVNYEEAVKGIAKLKIENEDLKKTQQELREEVKKAVMDKKKQRDNLQ